MGLIYKLTFPSRKSYIGLTTQSIHNRIRAHLGSSVRGKTVLFSAIRKYGKDSFSVEIIGRENDFSKLKSLERRLIAEHKTKVPNGYNMTDGGDGVLGIMIDFEQRRKRSQSQLKSYMNPERRAKHRAAQMKQELRNFRSVKQKKLMADPRHVKLISSKMKLRWKDSGYREKMAARRTKPKINDGLNKWQRYRLRDLDGYRKRKADYARTPEQRKKRKEYMRKWVALNPDKVKAQTRRKYLRKKARESFCA